MSKRILVIDDDEAIRKSFALALEDTPYSVLTAESGEKGIRMIETEGCDLVFLDLKMPGMNGVETLREIRKRDLNVPVYIITAFYGEYFDLLKKAGQEGIHFEVMKKPIGLEEIDMVTRSMFEGPVSQPE